MVIWTQADPHIIRRCIMYRVQNYGVGVTGNYRWGTYTVKCLRHHNILSLIRPCRLPTPTLQKLTCDSHKNFCDHYKIILWLFTYEKCLLLSQNNFMNIVLLQSQNLFCKTSKAFWLYLTKYFVSNLNPNNRIRVTRFQQPGTQFLNRVISQFTTSTHYPSATPKQCMVMKTINK